MTTPTTVQVRFQLRADTAANWTSINPTLLNNEFALETDTKKLKVGNGSTAWNSLAYFPSIVSGGTVLGNLEIGSTGTLTFEGSTADGFETTLAVTNPTADRTITLPNQSGTVVVSGNASIVDADIAANAEIAVSKLADGAARQLLQTDAAGTGVEWTDNVDIPGTLDVTGAATFDAAVTIAGDLTVNGTTTNINTQNLVVEDKNVILGDVATPTDVAADGGGITLKGSTDKTISWVDATDAWTLSEHVNIASSKEYRIDGTKVLDATSLGSAVQISSSNIPSGTIVDDDISATAEIAVSKLADGAARQLLQTDAAGTGVEWTDNIDVPGTLDVTSTATFDSIISASAGAAATPSVTFTGDVNTGIYSPGADQVAISTGGSGRLFVDASGNVGIGASAPGGLLHVQSNLAGNNQLILTNIASSNSGAGSEIVFTQGASGFAAGKIQCDREGSYSATTTSQDSALAFFTATDGVDSEKLRITSAGLVGIGTTSPGDNLTVEKDATSAATGGFTLQSASSNASVMTMGVSTSLDSASIASLRTGTGTVRPLTFIVGTNSANERMRIDTSGRLLVGTSTSTTTNNLFEVAHSGVAKLQFGSIGTSSNSALRISRNDTTVGADNPLGYLEFGGNDSTGNVDTAFAWIGAEADGVHDPGDNPTRLVFSTTASGASSPTERLRITSTGRLGLATTAPAATAHIAGNTIVSNVAVANATYDSVSFSVATQETQPSGLFFSPDGRKMFVIGTGGDDINEYTLSTPWNVSTATYVTVFSVASQDTVPNDLYFRNDGKKLFVVGATNDSIYQYSLSTPWSIASASYDSVSFSVATEETIPAGLFFKPDGFAAYIVGNGSDNVRRYNLTTAWDISTAALANSFSVGGQESIPQTLSFTADGSRMFVMGTSGDDINIYNLTTPWDITTASFVTTFSVATQEDAPTGLFVKPDGTKFYIAGQTNDTVYQYTIPSTTIDLTGTTNINGSAEVAQDLTVRGGVGFYGTTAIAQPAGTGETTGFTAGTGTAVNDASTFTGNLGTTAYRINDVVKALKQLGLLKL